MIDKQAFLLFIKNKVKSKKTTINLERLVIAFLDYDNPTYKVLGETPSTLSAKLKRLFKDSISNKPTSMSVDTYFLLQYGYKFCSSCKQSININSFYADKHTATGLQSECIVCVKSRNRIAYINNPEYNKNNAKNWRENNRAAYNALMAKRRASKYNATPKWLTKEQLSDIKKFYKQAVEENKVVDHIVPLQGKNVCGLHVPWNLQLLTNSENASKGNRYDY